MAFVDFGKQKQDAGVMTSLLKRFGLSVNFRDAIGVLAKRVRDHQHFATLITECEPEFRQEFYDSVKPHLKFRAKPLDSYIADAKQRAERDRLPTLDELGGLRPFTPATDLPSIQKHAQALLDKETADRTLILACGICTETETFYGTAQQTKVDVVIKARKAGWIYDNTGETPREICPKCPTPLRKTE